VLNRLKQKKRERKKVLSSYAFRYWWRARRKQRPIPQNPYRAFMIDLGLSARIEPTQIWKRRPNRTDRPMIDFPYFRRPLPPKDVPRKQKKRIKRRQRVKPQRGIRKEIRQILEKMAEKYHVPMPEIRFHARTMLRSHYRAGMRTIRKGTTWKFERFAEIVLGTKGQKPLLKATAAHEMGHHIISHQRYQKLGTSVGFGAGTLREEVQAWKLADPFLKEARAAQKWFGRFALETHRKQGRMTITLT